MRVSVAALLLLMCIPAPAQAEGGAGMASIFSAGIFQETVIPVRTSTLRGVQPAGETTARLPAEALRFAATRRVELEARQRLLSSLLATTDDAADREQIRESVTSDEVWREFDRILSFAGYSSRNLADVTTAYYVINWEVVSGKHAIDYLSGVRFVRDAVAEYLRVEPRVAAMTDFEKQEASVAMAYMAIVAAAQARDLRRSGDRAGLARHRELVRRSVVRGQGVDLAGLQLTNLGFVVD